MSSGSAQPVDPARISPAVENPYASPEAPVSDTPLFQGWRWFWAQCCHYGFMVAAGLPASFLFPVLGHRLLHGQWAPASSCLPLLFAIWVPAWIVCGFGASGFWAVGAATFWPRKDVKELVRGRTRIPVVTTLTDRALDALFDAFHIP